MYDEDLKRIFTAIESGKCLAFLGAGASAYFKKGKQEIKGLPLGGQLAKELAKECGYTNGQVYDLAKVAEYFVYTQSGDRSELEKLLKKQLNIGCPPRPIHTVLAQLDSIKIVLTSNYDDLFETELRTYSRLLTKNVYKRTNSQNALFDGPIFFESNEIVFHKMHGSLDEPNSMVITQSDYIRYLANLKDPDRGMPEYFWKTMIPQFTLLFLGYSLDDWNFRVIWEGVLSKHQKLGVRKTSYALVKKPQHFMTSYWRKHDIEVIDQDLTEFAIKLAEHFNLEIPQLDIKKREEAGGEL